MKTHCFFSHRRAVGAWVISAIVLAAGLGLVSPVKAEGDAKPAVVPVGLRLQNLSVTVRAGSLGGSGTIIVRDIEGKKTAFILTAAHVLPNLRNVQTVITESGREAKHISYRDAETLQEFRENGERVGDTRYLCKVVCVDSQKDVALLRVRVTGKFTDSAEFWLDPTIPPPGTQVYHCASPAGEAASLTSGIIAQIGRRIEEYGGAEAVYDQVTCAALGGSSGGMVVLADSGKQIGILTLGLGGTANFNYIVPVRRISQWATENQLEWLLDPAKKPPTEAELKKVAIEPSPYKEKTPVREGQIDEAPILIRHIQSFQAMRGVLLDHNDPVEYDLPLED